MFSGDRSEPGSQLLIYTTESQSTIGCPRFHAPSPSKWHTKAPAAHEETCQPFLELLFTFTQLLSPGAINQNFSISPIFLLLTEQKPSL